MPTGPSMPSAQACSGGRGATSSIASGSSEILRVLSDAGVDYIRVLGSVGGDSWKDREVDPAWPDYDKVIAGLTDLAYDRYGLRVQWTLFGGAPFTPPGRARDALVDRFATHVARPRAQDIRLRDRQRSTIERIRGPEGIAELRRLGARLSKTSVLVALSDPAAGEECATYAGARIDAATIHYERGFGQEGPLRPIRGPWRYPAAYDADCRGQLPALVFNNEPIGPESSVRQDDDPAQNRRCIRPDVSRQSRRIRAPCRTRHSRRRSGRCRAVPCAGMRISMSCRRSQRIATALTAAKRYLPPGLANWTRHEPDAKDGAHLRSRAHLHRDVGFRLRSARSRCCKSQ